MYKLAIQKYIAQHGLEKTVADFALEMRQNQNLVLLKYNSIESDYKHEEVQDSRGIILEKDTWNIVSLSFRKFFNHGESYAHEIDWESAVIYKKYDGSLISVYHYNNEWHTATTGTIDGMASVGYHEDLTFSGLFWKAINQVTGLSKEEYTSHLKKGYTYMFELCTPYNIVVCPHGESQVYLLGIRDLNTLKEVPHNQLHSWNLHTPIAEVIPITADLDALHTSLQNKPFHEEGYIICDKHFNRLKIKNPSYVAAHHLKGKTALHHILTIIKSNEVEEYAATFVERAEEIRELEKAYHSLIASLDSLWENELNSGIGYTSRKHYAEIVFGLVKETDTRMFTDFFFTMKDKSELDTRVEKLREEGETEENIQKVIDRLSNFNARVYIEHYKERELYDILKKLS